MFERYTERARRCVFFARYEASEAGSSYVEVDHFLLGIWREDKSFVDRILTGTDERIVIAEELRALRPSKAKTATTVDLPLSPSAKRVLAYAAEEAQRLRHNYISTSHLLLAVLREPSLATDVLHRHDLSRDKLRTVMTDVGAERLSGSAGSASSLNTLQQEFRNLTARLTHDIEPALTFRLL